jgi:enolase
VNSLNIADVLAWEALDSRGRPTVGCRVELVGGGVGRVVVPSGASTGQHEAKELRDGGERYGGYGVRRAVASVNEVLAPLVSGRSAADRVGIDAMMEKADGQQDLGRLGSNAVLAVSLAVTLANADGRREPLWATLDPSGVPLIPMPMVNIFSGGAHAGRAVDVQDFLVIPVAAGSFAEAMEWVARVREASAALLDAAGGWSALLADEGGLAGRFAANEEVLQILTRAIAEAGLEPGGQVAIAIDVAASQLSDGTDILLASQDERLSGEEWVARLGEWLGSYPIVSIEDALDENDWAGWRLAADRLEGVQLIGDDLFATDFDRLNRGIESGVANSVLVKVNQAGTVSRAERVLHRATEAGLGTVVSARSGDTEDSWLSDLAVGWRAGQIKVGSTMRGERTAKWNRLLELEAAGETVFAGTDYIPGLRP